MESVTLKAVMVLPALLLQKSFMQSKPCDHLQHPQLTTLKCLLAWYVFHGKIKAAMRFLTEHSRCSFLPSSIPVEESTIFDELIKKHPDPSPATSLSLINPDATTTLKNCCYSVIFDCLDGDLIHRTATYVSVLRCPQGLKGLDALGWRHSCTSFWIVHQISVTPWLQLQEVSLRHLLFQMPCSPSRHAYIMLE